MPWFTPKKDFWFYDDAITTKNTSFKIRTDGFYHQYNSRAENSPEILIFQTNGDFINLSYEKTPLEACNYFVQKDTIFSTHGWYKLSGDSVLLEYHGRVGYLINSFNFIYGGEILNKHADSFFIETSDYLPAEKYKFYPCDLPVLINNAPYLEKRWYSENLNSERSASIK
jgi:hypothetical protein